MVSRVQSQISMKKHENLFQWVTFISRGENLFNSIYIKEKKQQSNDKLIGSFISMDIGMESY